MNGTSSRSPLTRAIVVLIALGIAALLAACGSASAADSPATSTASAADSSPTTTPSPGSRPSPIIYRPSNLGYSQKVPLLIALPGLGGTPTNMQRGTQFDQIADQHGFVVAYLASDDQAHPWSPHGDDLPYVSSMITQLTNSENIDPNRVYVTGFSAGAAFTYIVACKLSSQVAGIAPVSAVMNVVVTAPCALAHPVSVLTIIGSLDGAINGHPPRLLSAVQTAAAWRAKDNCPSSQPSFTGQSGSAREQLWSNCVDGSAVGLYVIQGGGHIYPGDQSFGLPPSNPDMQFSASPAIWAFMSSRVAGTKVSAGISGVKVKKVKSSSVVTVSFRHAEPVAIACTLGLGRGRTLRRSLLLGLASRTPAVFKVPRGTKAGRHPLTCGFTDPYSRTLTVHRKIALT